MDLTSRKNKFIEQFMKLTSLTKIKRLEEVLHAETNEKDEIVAYTITGEPLTKEQYIKDLKQAEEEIEKGEFISHEDLKKEVRAWRR